jgi:hypothetical protein
VFHPPPRSTPSGRPRRGGQRTHRAAEPGTRAIQLLAAGRARTGSKIQQRFARLIRQVDQRKQRLRVWYDMQPAIQRELATYRAEFEVHRRAAHDLVCLFDRVHGDPALTRPERKRLSAMIVEVAGDLITGGGFDDLKPIYNRHGRSDFDAEAAFGDAVNARAMKAMMEEVFGVDFGDADVSSTEKLHAFTEEQLRAFEDKEAQAESRRARRKKSAKQAAREAQREAEKAKVGKVLQEVYRKLAIALHPDLEQDPAERTRKTELMAQVNIAYKAQDLLRLLELQLQLEQIDPDHASDVAEDRLRHYNKILDQQVKELDAELDELEMPWRMELDLLGAAPILPARMLARVRADTEDLKQQIGQLRRDLEAFQDVTRLKAWLKSSLVRGRGGRGGRGGRADLDLFR